MATGTDDTPHIDPFHLQVTDHVYDGFYMARVHLVHLVTMHTSVSVKVYSRTSSWEDGVTNVTFLAFTCMVLFLVIAFGRPTPIQIGAPCELHYVAI
jgi:hypothetical protein